MKVQTISKNDVKRMKTRKAVGPDDIPVDVQRCVTEGSEL